jgi:hypothetical protein
VQQGLILKKSQLELLHGRLSLIDGREECKETKKPLEKAAFVLSRK